MSGPASVSCDIIPTIQKPDIVIVNRNSKIIIIKNKLF